MRREKGDVRREKGDVAHLRSIICYVPFSRPRTRWTWASTWAASARGQLPRPEHPLRARVGYHQPCHLRALEVGTPGLDLIREIPELDVEFIDRGCSGMAGTFGLTRDHFRTSLRAGRGLLNRLRVDDIELGATECGACRMQMEQGVPKRTLHPIKLLSLSYGLNPSLRRQFKDPKPRHEIS